MNRSRKLFLSVFTLGLFMGVFAQNEPSNTLPLQDFLKEFRAANLEYQTLEEKIKAARLNQSRANLFTPTDFFAGSLWRKNNVVFLFSDTHF